MPTPTVESLAARVDKLESQLNVKLGGGGYVDPPPYPWGGGFPPWGGGFPPWFNPPQLPHIPHFPPVPDPAPTDISRMTRAQLEVSREMIKSHIGRLQGMDKLIADQIDALK